MHSAAKLYILSIWRFNLEKGSNESMCSPVPKWEIGSIIFATAPIAPRALLPISVFVRMAESTGIVSCLMMALDAGSQCWRAVIQVS